jgi:hypothetical protein
MHFRIFIPLLGSLLLASATHALTPPPPQPNDKLLPMLYAQLDGDNWHRNDGWLDDDVHWCEWYGVTCSEDDFWGYYDFLALELPDNNLSGEVNDELAWLLLRHVPPREQLDLANNDIGGSLHHFPISTRNVDLSGNRLAGPLPAVDPDIHPRIDQHLLLARNRFEGAVPESWTELGLRRLDLADNLLNNGFLHAFHAVSDVNSGKSHLDLAGNRFSGELTSDIFIADFNPNDQGNVGGGLRICFNDFTIADDDVAEWIAGRHAGGPEFEQCLGRERSDMAADISGSWFNPDFDGEGVALQLLDTGAPLLYSFSFDWQGRQQWLFEVGHPAPQSFQWEALLETRGDFGQGFRFHRDDPLMRGLSRMRFDRLDDDALHVERNYYDRAACGPLPSPPPDPMMGPCLPPLYADRLDYQRLTDMAGTTCDNQTDYQQYSGAWYNPEQPGEGFIVEVLQDDQTLVYWFTYAADGSGAQAWMTGVDRIGHPPPIIGTPPPPPPGTPLEVETLWQPIGATYGPDFDPADVERIDWGWLGIQFDDADSGHVFFESHLEDFGTGDFPIERLARPMLAECD